MEDCGTDLRERRRAGDVMKHLSRIAEFWLGERTRRDIFDPLLADFDGEVRGDRSITTRARWWLAVASTFAICIPRQIVTALPLALATDIVLRVIGFALASVGVQWLVMTFSPDHGVVPISLMTTLPFALLPVMWRI